ncbi:MAG: PrsW family glutamic-type intramembrane protease [Thermoplasmatota archaeon]
MIFDIILLMMAAFASILLPILSLSSWSGLLAYTSRYAREVFAYQVLWKTKEAVLRYSSFSITPVLFILSGVISAGFAIAVGFVFLLFMAVSGLSIEIIGFISLVSAGPVEETGKLLVAIGLYALLMVLGKKVGETREVKGKNRVKDGMLIGMFVGASFGFIESILYLIMGFIGLKQNGFMFQTIDPVIFRIILGVSIHAVFTGIASAGLGQKGWKRKVVYTVLVLGIAASVHSLNNGISGFASIILGLDSLLSLLIVDTLQIILVVFDFIILIIFWNYLSRNSE